MGFRFRKSVKIAPGVKLNFSKKSTGVTFGGKGFHYTINSKGKKTTTVGIPGTGISYSTSSNSSTGNKKNTKSKKAGIEAMSTPISKKWYQKTGFIILFLMIFFPVGLFLMWRHSIWSKNTKIIVSAIIALLFIIGCASSTTEEHTEPAINSDNTIAEYASDEISSEIKEITTKQETTTKITTEAETTTEITTIEKTTVAETTTEKAPETEKTTTEKVQETEKPAGRTVYITPSGKKYHLDPDCGGKNSRAVSIDNVGGRGPCNKCAQ